MESTDYITDLEEEVQVLRVRVTQLEEELRIAREELSIARERKVEETDEGVPPEEISPRDHTKKEETPSHGLGTRGVKYEESEVKPTVKHRTRPNKTEIIDIADTTPTGKRSQPSSDHSQNDDDDDDDDVIIVDLLRRSPGKRKVEDIDDRPTIRSPKRQTFWVEVPPRPKRKRISSSPVKVEESVLEGTSRAATSTPAVKEEPDQEIANALSAIRNTSLKKDTKALDDVSVFTRLSKVGLELFPISIEDEIKEVSVGRTFLSRTFGGSAVEAFPKIGEERLKKHGFDNFMCINLTLHPHAPSVPGAPGLWMDTAKNLNRQPIKDQRLIVRVKATSPTLWQYMGQYEIRPSDPLSLQEWTMQSEKTKKGWVKYFREEGWGGDVRARVVFRKREGREPTEDEEAGLGSASPEEVTEEEIREAFDKDKERLYTCTLKCHGYDEGFQRAIRKAALAQANEDG